ncbi:MAG: DUF1801 domain-containing protein [Anaerolineales bacterium]|nr:DUF1801 domain-containing protein [Anaerolineales bacterium]
MAKTNFQSIDEYIAACPPDSQAYLQEIRKLIRRLVPDAKERISYQIAAFERKKHVSLYPVPAGSEAFERQIAKYVDGKGTVKFALDEPLPLKLIERVVKLHLEANKKITKGD